MSKDRKYILQTICRSRTPELFLGKRVLKICSKFTGEHPCGSVISIELLCIFSEHLFLRKPLVGCFSISYR